MGIFQQFPYSNFHEYNLDELIKIVKQLADDWAAYQTKWSNLYTDTEEALTDFKEYVYNYFENLDLQDEVNTRINALIAEGFFDPIIQEELSPVVTAWLADNITVPVGVVIDTSLSIAGACADAKATGDADRAAATRMKEMAISRFRKEFNVLDLYEKESREHNGITFDWTEKGCYVHGTSTGTANSRIFYSLTELPLCIQLGMPVRLQIESDDPNSVVHLDIFRCVGGAVGARWVNLTTANNGGVMYSDVPTNTEGLLVRISVVGANVTADENVRISMVPQISELNIHDGNTFINDADGNTENGIYFISTGGTPPVNYPYHAPGWLYVQNIGISNDVGVLQVYYPWNSEVHDIMWRTSNRGVWNSWKALGSGGGGGDVIIQNTYNITTSPAITTDDHGWLVPVDTESASDAGKTDMTGPIMSMLTSTGYCHLAPGIFYVSGNIDMPAGSTLIGCGQDTIIRLLSSTSSGYIVRASQYNTVKDIRFSGGYSAIDVSSETVGTRHGLVYVGNEDGSSPAIPTALPSMVNNCWFDNFSGAGIYCNNSGNSVNQPLIVSDCFIRYCGAGIDIKYLAEYLKFTNVVTYHCHYACINNGGNNTFTGCTFHGTVGFLIQNGTNSGHGSCIGCTFNHIDSWNDPSGSGNGNAIQISSLSNGFMFTGCQIWYGKVIIQNSRGVSISDTQFGGGYPVIKVSGSYGAFFNNCIFHASPTITKNSATKFNGCYLDSDSSIIN